MNEQENWEVFVIEFARKRNKPWVDLISGMYPDGTVDLTFSFVFARAGDRRVLVDTGFMQTDFSEQFDIPDWTSPVKMLSKLGVAAESITDVVLTHAHYDHMGSIREFPAAHIYIQKAELLSWHEAMALPPQFGHLTRIIDPDNLRAAFDASVEHRLTLVEGDVDDLLPGLHLRLGSGHTIGQQYVILETARGRLVIAGDCVYSTRQITGHNRDGVYAPLNNAFGSVWDQLKTIDRINGEIAGDLDRLIVLHDVERWKSLPIAAEVDGFIIVKAA